MKKFLNISLFILSLNAMQKLPYTKENPATPAQAAAYWASVKPLNQPLFIPKVSGADQLNYYSNVPNINTICVNQCFQAHPLPPMIDNCKVRVESDFYVHKNNDLNSIQNSNLCQNFTKCLVSRCNYKPTNPFKANYLNERNYSEVSPTARRSSFNTDLFYRDIHKI